MESFSSFLFSMNFHYFSFKTVCSQQHARSTQRHNNTRLHNMACLKYYNACLQHLQYKPVRSCQPPPGLWLWSDVWVTSAAQPWTHLTCSSSCVYTAWAVSTLLMCNMWYNLNHNFRHQLNILQTVFTNVNWSIMAPCHSVTFPHTLTCLFSSCKVFCWAVTYTGAMGYVVYSEPGSDFLCGIPDKMAAHVWPSWGRWEWQQRRLSFQSHLQSTHLCTWGTTRHSAPSPVDWPTAHTLQLLCVQSGVPLQSYH